MVEFVRVSDPISKAHVTVSAAEAARLGLTPLKQSAVDRNGRPLRAKSRTNLPPAVAASGSSEEKE